VDGKIAFEKQMTDLESAMQHVAAASDVTVCEGM